MKMCKILVICKTDMHWVLFASTRPNQHKEIETNQSKSKTKEHYLEQQKVQLWLMKTKFLCSHKNSRFIELNYVSWTLRPTKNSIFCLMGKYCFYEKQQKIQLRERSSHVISMPNYKILTKKRTVPCFIKRPNREPCPTVGGNHERAMIGLNKVTHSCRSSAEKNDDKHPPVRKPTFPMRSSYN
jgi:hypothetical protein